MKIGFFIPNWVGDTAMCTPALRAARKHFGAHAQLLGILRPYVADVLEGTSWLDEQILFSPKSPDPCQRTAAVWRNLRDRKLDAIVMFTNSFRSAAMARLARAPLRVGYVRYGRDWLLTHRLYPPRLGRSWLPTPAIDSYLQLAYAVGCAWEAPRLELATLATDEQAADAVWEKHRLPAGEQVVVLNSGGAYGAAKHWPAEQFAQLARRIVDELGLAVLVTCGPSERRAAQEIVAGAARRGVVSLAEEAVSIGLTKACIRRCRLLITTDSGPRFFGVAFGRPVITLFGPTDPAWTRTHYDDEVVLQHRVPCGPCGKRTCPLTHHECMRLLSVDRVFAAVGDALAKRPRILAA